MHINHLEPSFKLCSRRGVPQPAKRNILRRTVTDQEA